MIELIIGTYGLGCWLVFKKFKLIPITTYTVCTAILGGIFLLMGILITVSMYHPVAHDGRFYAAVTQITPQVRGTVIEVPVAPNTPLKQNDVLFKIDPTPYQLDVDRLEAVLAGMNTQAAQLASKLEAAEAAKRAAESNLAITESEYDRQARIALEQATEQITQTQSRLDYANADLKRYTDLRKKGAVSEQQLEQVQTRAESLTVELAQAKAAERSAREKVDSGSDRLKTARETLKQAEAEETSARLALEAESDGMNPEVRQALAELESKRWELEQTTVRAPSDGYATYVALRPGQMAVPLPITAPMVFVPAERPLFIASFPQTVIANFEPGLEAELAFKAYPGKIFKAKLKQVLPIIPEGTIAPSGRLQAVTPATAPGHIPVQFEYGEEIENLNLPVGAQASVAVYTHHVHAMSIVRKIVLRIKSWENYVFFLSNLNVGH
jgi:multidrug resistance efflux pump